MLSNGRTRQAANGSDGFQEYSCSFVYWAFSPVACGLLTPVLFLNYGWC
jgi:hypothetical protein